MSSLERFSEYRGFGLERFHCTGCVSVFDMPGMISGENTVLLSNVCFKV